LRQAGGEFAGANTRAITDLVHYRARGFGCLAGEKVLWLTFKICATRHSEGAKRLKNPLSEKRRKNFGGFFATLRMTSKNKRRTNPEYEPSTFTRSPDLISQ
jgi:hypothetical protein